MRVSIFCPILFAIMLLAFPKVSFCQEWVKTFSSIAMNLYVYGIKEDYDHVYLLCANKSFTGNMKIGWIIKTDINGNVLWEKELGNGDRKWALGGIDKTPDGGVIVAGACDTLDNGWWDPFIVKLSACVDIQWCHIFHNANDPDYGIRIRTLPGNSYIFLITSVAL